MLLEVGAFSHPNFGIFRGYIRSSNTDDLLERSGDPSTDSRTVIKGCDSLREERNNYVTRTHICASRLRLAFCYCVRHFIVEIWMESGNVFSSFSRLDTQHIINKTLNMLCNDTKSRDSVIALKISSKLRKNRPLLTYIPPQTSNEVQSWSSHSNSFHSRLLNFWFLLY